MERKRAPLARAASVLTIGAMIAGSSLITAAPASAHSHRDWRRERGHIEDRARSEHGTRYSYGGTSPRSGFDCSGFTRWVFVEHGATLPHSSMAQFDMARRQGYKRIWKIRNLEVGDLVFFKTTSARVGHAGIYIGNGPIHPFELVGGWGQDRFGNDRYYYRASFRRRNARAGHPALLI